jgi:hypothetical protein
MRRANDMNNCSPSNCQFELLLAAELRYKTPRASATGEVASAGGGTMVDVLSQQANGSGATSTAEAAPPEVTRALKDRTLGAIWALAHGRRCELPDVAERLEGVPHEQLARSLGSLDRDDMVVLERRDGCRTAALSPAAAVPATEPRPLRDRIRGALYLLAGGRRSIPLVELRKRMGDVPLVEFERALLALTVSGHLRFGSEDGRSVVTLVRRGRFAEVTLRSLEDRVRGALTSLVRVPRRGAEKPASSASLRPTT